MNSFLSSCSYFPILLLILLPHSNVWQPDGHFGKSQDRAKIKGSPVVPGSSEKLYEDGESALYTVTILKGQYEAGFYEGDSFQQVRARYMDIGENRGARGGEWGRNWSDFPSVNSLSSWYAYGYV